jgi:hypothetical protein
MRFAGSSNETGIKLCYDRFPFLMRKSKIKSNNCIQPDNPPFSKKWAKRGNLHLHYLAISNILCVATPADF